MTARAEPAPPAPSLPAVSLVVCTRDRAARLGDFFAHLECLRPALPFEVVLVDNASRDATPAMLEAFAARTALPVRLLHEPRVGLGAARNAGVRASRAPLLVFIDDDCYPAPDLLDRWAAAFADARVGFGAGRVLLHDPDDAPITIRTEAEPARFAPGTLLPPGAVQGANVAYRREVLAAIGGFDPVLGPGGTFNFEDLDTAARALDAGWPGLYAPAAVVRHHHRRRAHDEVEALRRSYAHGAGAYYASRLLAGSAWRQVARAFRAGMGAHAAATAARELAGAVHYLAWRATHRPERPLAEGGAPGGALPAPAAATSRRAG